MKSFLLLKTISISTLLLLLAGCSSKAPMHYHAGGPDFLGLHKKIVYIGYPGKIKPIHEVGVVTFDFTLKLKEIDGIPVKKYRTLKSGGLLYSKSFAYATDLPYPERSQIHFPAGKHTLKIGFLEYVGNGTRYKSKGDVVRTITIAPNTVTHVSLTRGSSKWTVSFSDGIEGLDLIKEDFDELRNSVGEPL